MKTNCFNCMFCFIDLSVHQKPLCVQGFTQETVITSTPESTPICTEQQLVIGCEHWHPLIKCATCEYQIVGLHGSTTCCELQDDLPCSYEQLHDGCMSWQSIHIAYYNEDKTQTTKKTFTKAH